MQVADKEARSALAVKQAREGYAYGEGNPGRLGRSRPPRENPVLPEKREKHLAPN